ncbi:MAG: HAD-IB family hydrolase [Verrucomicrobiales bacterium]|nr:HAD-IB family hydrolase [Verrucomicrobiales bacterium]
MSPRGYALFDLDHTLLPHDTQVLFCNFVLRKKGNGWRRIYLLWFLPLFPLALVKVVSLRFMKRVFSGYLAGLSGEKVRAYAREFAESVVPHVAYEETVAELRRHQAEGRITILNSASPEFYVEEIARHWGFDHYLGTNLIIEQKMPLFPKIMGPNNKHGAKITAMQERGMLPDEFDASDPDARLPDSVAYSDSSADVPLLSIAERGYMIHPSANFAETGTERQWETMTPPRPYASKLGDRWTQLRQALGLYKISQGVRPA